MYVLGAPTLLHETYNQGQIEFGLWSYLNYSSITLQGFGSRDICSIRVFLAVPGAQYGGAKVSLSESTLRVLRIPW